MTSALMTRVLGWTKVLPLFAGSFGALAGFSAQAQNPIFDDPVLMPIVTVAPVKTIFVPVGFDDNDTVEVIVHGHFDDSCNKMGTAIGLVDGETNTIEITARGLRYQGNECIPMQVPFLQSVKLGQLAAGTYTVRMRAPGGSDGTAPADATQPEAVTLTVAKATVPTADDSLYAPVDEVSFAPVRTPGGPANGEYMLTVSGVFPRSEDGCMLLDDVKVLTFPNVLVVLPIARFERDFALCLPSLTSFGRSFVGSKSVKLDLKRDTLIHVRVLNGQSVNRIVEIEN
jgi:hypothetical protein